MHNLNPEFQASILQEVIKEDKSLKEMKDEAVKFRSLESVKQPFMCCTNSQSWDDATAKYSAFTNTDCLAQFTKLNFRHHIPDIFKTYCQSAFNLQNFANGSVKLFNGVKVAVVRGALSEISTRQLKEVDSSYTRVELIVAKIPKVQITYNALCGWLCACTHIHLDQTHLHVHNIIAMHSMEQLLLEYT